MLERHRRGRGLPRWLSQVVLGPVRVAASSVTSVGVFALVCATALFGDTDPFANLAPTWIFVVFWIGVPILSVVLGQRRRALSPWRALADGFVWIWERSGA